MRSLIYLCSFFIFMTSSGFGCEKSAIVDHSPQVVLDSFRCQGVVDHCTRLAEIAAAHPIKLYDQADWESRIISAKLLRFLIDSTQTAGEFARNEIGNCPELTQEDIRCILGEPDNTPFVLYHGSTLLKADPYLMSWDVEETRQTPNPLKYAPAAPLFVFYYVAETRKLAGTSSNW